jgi:uncharacterized protein YjbI with pentapeptide repeats
MADYRREAEFTGSECQKADFSRVYLTKARFFLSNINLDKSIPSDKSV